MNDKTIVRDIVKGTISMDELQDKILHIFMAEIQSAIMVSAKHPVDTGHMRRKWVSMLSGRHQLIFTNNTVYLPFHITGTGLYGPQHQMICAKGMSEKNPRHAHVMAWRPPGGTKLMFRRCTKGIHANPFIDEGIEAGIENGCEAIMELFSRAGNTIE
jgi:hypothetical protein